MKEVTEPFDTKKAPRSFHRNNCSVVQDKVLEEPLQLKISTRTNGPSAYPKEKPGATLEKCNWPKTLD